MKATPQPANPPQLAYAPRGRWAWRLPRRYALAGAGVALAIVAWRWSGDAARAAQVIYWSRQCMRYSPPADLVVFEQDASRIAPLMRANAGYHVSTAGEADPPHAWLSPQSYAFVPQSGWAPHVTFMHGRRSGDGPERLVVIEFLALREPHTANHTVLFHPRVFATSMLRPPTQVRRNEDTIRISLAPDERLRLYAGQPNPTDPSRFTIDCLIAGEHGTIEGQLRRGDVVTFRPIAGAGLKRRWRSWDRTTTRPWWDPKSQADTLPLLELSVGSS
jgi:hypothetical protein